MMVDLDQMLDALAHAEPPPRLERLGADVIAEVHVLADRDRRAPPRLAIAAAIGAAVMGVAGAGLPAATPAAASLAPLGGASPLAPSTLLLGDQ